MSAKQVPRNMDTPIRALIAEEAMRQQQTIDLIASENYVSAEVLGALGSCLTNKYAEGLPRKRYYEGCEVVDQIEELAIERCKKLFSTPTASVEHVNVQPHAGSQANMAAYMAMLAPGDTIMGMALSSGGHLTHGHNVSFSGIWYKAVQYGVDPETYLLDYDAIEELAHAHKPKLIVAGASSYSRLIDFARFAQIAKSVGALFAADIAHIAGLVAVGEHPTPVGLADCIMSTTHKTLRGPRGGLLMSTQKIGEKIDRAIMPGLQGGPALNVIAAKAVAFAEALEPRFAHDQRQTIANARALAKACTDLGYQVLTGGTDNHMFVIDLRGQQITGLEAARTLARVGIVSSRSTIPYDTQKPWITSGIRFGTPAVTTRGMQEAEMSAIAQFVHDALTHRAQDSYLEKLRAEVMHFTARFETFLGQ